MSKFCISTKKRLIIFLLFTCFIFLGLIIRIGYLQLVKGDYLKQEALSQQTRDITIEAKRGVIYDRKGKDLAISIVKSTIWVDPSKIKDKKKSAQILSNILKEDEKEILEKISKNDGKIVKLKRWIEDDIALNIKKAKILGVWTDKDSKRYYPYGDFAAYVLGHVSSDNSGAAGVELEYDEYLRGLPGRVVMNTDTSGRETPYGSQKYNEPKDGLGIMLTIDETIQHYAEKAISKALQVNNAKKAYAIVMDVKTGDILAMVSKPDYNPNDPTKAIYPLFKEEIAKYPDEKKVNGLFQMWRNPVVNDTYEPGSTFKLIVSAAALEQGTLDKDEKFYCNGYINVADKKIKCAIYPRGHGLQTFKQAVQNSCNVAFVQIGQKLGIDNLYEYISAFGLTKPTGIDLPGEGKGIIYAKKHVGPVELATMSFGQSISVTPIQLITAISAIANDGKLMKPRVVKELVDSKGDIVKKFNPEMVSQVISPETSKTIRQTMESVVSEGGGKVAYIPGYNIGGKTGTAQKVIDGKYAKSKYITSFIGIAPSDNPEIAILVVLDEPVGENVFGSTTAAPVAKEIIYDTLRYLEFKPSYSESEKASLIKEEIIVPEVRNLKLEEAGKILFENKLNFTVETHIDADANATVIDMFPKPESKVPIESTITLYIKSKNEVNGEVSKVIIPDLIGKTIKETSNILQGLGLKLKYVGNGVVVKQNPIPNSQVDVNSIVNVEFK